MKKTTTKDRLNSVMKNRGLRQADILELCKPYCKKYDVKIGRNDISQYVNGKNEPGQQKLTVLALALGVNEVWLMGYDVSPEPISDMSKIDVIGDLTPVEQRCITELRKLNSDEKGMILNYMKFLRSQQGSS